jgi:mannose-6-phosphate isomerase-like protein (cupin superfamily)
MTKSPSDDEKNFRARIIEDIRPWGKFRAYPHKNAGSIKIITVKPGASLSLQFHHRRSEFWIALDRGLEITVGKKVWRPKKGEEIYIPRKTAHRLRCVGRSPARVMEIWLGNSDESDIVRLEDKYGRS